MFRGRGESTQAFQVLQTGAWGSDEDKSAIVSELVRLGKGIPFNVFFPLFEKSLQGMEDYKNQERCEMTLQVLNGLPFEILIPHYEDLLRMFLADRSGWLMNNFPSKFITRDPATIIRFLREGKEDIKKVAFRLITVHGKGVLYRELETSLRKDTWQDKKIGLFALREVAGARAIPILINFVENGSGQERYYAIELLSENDSLNVIQAFVKVAQKSKDSDLKIKIAWALGQTNSPKAIRPLVELTEDENWKVRVQAIRSLGKIKDALVIKPLKDLLEHTDHRIRREAVSVASKNCDLMLLPTLVDKLRDVQPTIRDMALETLGSLGRDEKVDKYRIVMTIMQSESSLVRGRLKDVLGMFQDDEIIHKLVLSLADEDYWVRQKVAFTLLHLAEQREIEFNLAIPLMELLHDPNDITRRFAVEILEKLNDPRTVDSLIRTLSDSDWWVRERATEALGNIGDPRALKHLVTLLKDEDIRYTAITAIAKFREPQTIKALAWTLKKGNRDCRIASIKALLEIGVPEVADYILEALNDDDILVRLEASQALGRLKAKLNSQSARIQLDSLEVADEKVVPLLDGLLLTAKKERATDLYLFADSKPYMRRNGEVHVVYPMHLSGAETDKLLQGIMNDDQKRIFKENLEIDFSYIIEKKGRFRVNVFVKKEGVSAVFRIIPDKVPTIEELNIPPVLKRFGEFNHGLVLITGAACQGKSTTMSAIVDYINHSRKLNIISIEEPIEYIHDNDMSQITQREIGVHTHSFANSLRSALRQDPDVIAIGELRDLESIAIAITAAETGHLVFGTLHAFSASKTIDRIIGVFPPNQQSQIRLQLAENIKGIVSQQLINTVEGGRTAAFEIMFANYSIRKLIRDRKTEQLPSMIVAAAEEGMILMDQFLIKLVHEGRISMDEALHRAHNPQEMERIMELQKEKAKEDFKSRVRVGGTGSSTQTGSFRSENLQES